MAPRVSIGIPVFDAEEYVDSAIESALNQTFEDFELIISDNASTDSTERICRGYAERDSRVIYDRLATNNGAIANFNRVFDLSKGEYFKWAAADDVFLPTFLEQCVGVLDARPEVVWCHTQSSKIDSSGNTLLANNPLADGVAHSTADGLPRKHFDDPRSYRRFRGVLLGTTWCPDIYGLIRADALRKSGLLPVCFGSEKVLLGELALLGLYDEVPETLFCKRAHMSAASKMNSGSDQVKFADPSARGGFVSNRLRLLRAYFCMIRRANICPRDHLMCYCALVQYLTQFGKWPSIMRGMIRDSGN